MEIKIYNILPEAAKRIRVAVFIKEQGFSVEFDETDEVATHIVAYLGDTPCGVCRIFPSENEREYIFGRLCVLPEYRKNGIGSKILSAAEKEVLSIGGKRLILHAQCRAADFYEKNGYSAFGEIGLDEGCPHVWMGKNL